jgi:hypothetical protein
MNDLSPHLELVGHDLHRAYARRVGRRRLLRTTGVVASLAAVFGAVALASTIDADLQLDPTKWSILGSGSVDQGRGGYVHGERRNDGSHSTFMVEHDAGLDRYDAFLLHERTRAAADASSPVPVATEAGKLCTAPQLTRAESVAMSTLRASFAPGADADATKRAVVAAIAAEFARTPCRGLEYAGEIARLVYAGAEPETGLMPGARP